MALASPILTVIYPPVLATVMLSFFHKYITPLTYRLSVLVTFVYGIFEVMASFGLRLKAFELLPLSSMGLGWILPWIITAVLVMIISKIKIIGNNCK